MRRPDPRPPPLTVHSTPERFRPGHLRATGHRNCRRERWAETVANRNTPRQTGPSWSRGSKVSCSPNAAGFYVFEDDCNVPRRMPGRIPDCRSPVSCLSNESRFRCSGFAHDPGPNQPGPIARISPPLTGSVPTSIPPRKNRFIISRPVAHPHRLLPPRQTEPPQSRPLHRLHFIAAPTLRRVPVQARPSPPAQPGCWDLSSLASPRQFTCPIRSTHHPIPAVASGATRDGRTVQVRSKDGLRMFLLPLCGLASYSPGP